MPTEKTPLDEIGDSLNEAYGCESHVKYGKDPGKTNSMGRAIVDYEPQKLSTFRVLCSAQGTILYDPVLFVEQILITLIFFACAFLTYYLFKYDLAENRHGKDVSMRRWISEQEGKMRAFAMIMTNLAAFLLSFYTSISVTRWWTMRAGGVGGIKAATVDLEWLLYQNVTQDETVLSAVRRYGRASLLLIFLWRQNKLGNLKEELMTRDILDEPECDQLLKWNHCLHETIWAWQGGIITMLHKEKKIKSDQLFVVLLQKCADGRAAVQCIHTHLAVRIPMQYVHVLGVLVKMHNLVLAIIMGLIFGVSLRESEIIICVQTFARTLILPFLFNAILLINAELSDPFNGSDADFPGSIYQAALDKDCKGFMSATQNVPQWVADRSSKV